MPSPEKERLLQVAISKLSNSIECLSQAMGSLKIYDIDLVEGLLEIRSELWDRLDHLESVLKALQK